MLLAEAFAPVDVDVGLGVLRTHQDQFLLQQLLHLHPRPVGWLVDQGCVEHPQLQLAQQAVAVADLGAYRVVADCLADTADPAQHQRVAQAHFATDVQHVVDASGNGRSRWAASQVCRIWLA